MKKLTRFVAIISLLFATLLLSGCKANVGVGLNVSVPVGNHGYVSLGRNVWR